LSVTLRRRVSITSEEKIINNKVGLVKLAQTVGTPLSEILTCAEIQKLIH
jgi:hypothetical protein